MLPTKVACPQCGSYLKTVKPFKPGQKVMCPKCQGRFILGAAPSAGPGALDVLPHPGINRTALLVILLGSLVVLGGGGALIYFIFVKAEEGEKKPQVVHKDQNREGPKDHSSGDDRSPKEKARPRPQPKPKAPKPLTHLSRGDQKRVDEAITRGVAYLRAGQQADGTWGANNAFPPNVAGLTALAGLTLVDCGVPRSDPAVKKAADYLRGREKSGNLLANTYDISLAVLFFDLLDDPQDRALIRKLALRLVAWQVPSGGWNYNGPPLADADGEILATLLDKTRGTLTADVSTSKLRLDAVDPSKLKLDDNKPVPARLAALPVWRGDTDVPAQVDSDNSNTQFAVLALWAAKARGVPVDRALARVVQRFHKTQNPDGSWGYHITEPQKTTNGYGAPPAAMTCSGLLGLAVGQGLVNEARGKAVSERKAAAQQDPAIQHGLDYLGKQAGDPHKPWENASSAPIVDMYFLWSLERVGVIFQLPKIGGKDWYGWGAEKLFVNQTIAGDKGYWAYGGNYPGQVPTVNTCFGLLFLKQANLAKDLTSKLALD